MPAGALGIEHRPEEGSAMERDDHGGTGSADAEAAPDGGMLKRAAAVAGGLLLGGLTSAFPGNESPPGYGEPVGFTDDDRP
jgi:hypothetical protein